MPSTPLRIMIVAGLCVLALIGLVVRESMMRASGTEVQMAMAGVDPRSVLSGNYVTVSLSEALHGAKCPDTSPDRQWLSLRADGPLYHVVASTPERAQASVNGAIAVRGTFTCYDNVLDIPSTLTADLGVQRFYINQEDAEHISALLRNASATATSPVNAIISIGADGRARLKGLSVNGQRLNLSWL